MPSATERLLSCPPCPDQGSISQSATYWSSWCTVFPTEQGATGHRLPYHRSPDEHRSLFHRQSRNGTLYHMDTILTRRYRDLTRRLIIDNQATGAGLDGPGQHPSIAKQTSQNAGTEKHIYPNAFWVSICRCAYRLGRHDVYWDLRCDPSIYSIQIERSIRMKIDRMTEWSKLLLELYEPDHHESLFKGLELIEALSGVSNILPLLLPDSNDTRCGLLQKSAEEQ